MENVGCLNVNESLPRLTDRAGLKKPSFHVNIKQRVKAQPQKYRATHFLTAGKDQGRKDDILYCFV